VTGRRDALGLMITTVAVAVLPRPAGAREYTSAAEVLDTIDGLAARVEASLSAIERVVPGAAPFASSVRADHARERAGRDAIRRRLRLSPSHPSPPVPVSAALDALRAVQQELVHAHAEGLPAIHDDAAVQVLARHMVEAARRLTVIDLWLELEGQRA